MFRVIFDPETIDFLQKAEKTTAKRIYNKIISTKSNPHHFWEKLAGRNDYKLRIGDFRAVVPEIYCV